MTNLHRFEIKFRVDASGCWLWTAATDECGYGRFLFRGRNTHAHRVSWILNFGEIPTGIQVCHKCDIPPCVNPDHLFLGTARDNRHDSIAKGRAFGSAVSLTRDPIFPIFTTRMGPNCRAGHPRIMGNIYIGRDGRVNCLICQRERQRRRLRQEYAQ